MVCGLFLVFFFVKKIFKSSIWPSPYCQLMKSILSFPIHQINCWYIVWSVKETQTLVLCLCLGKDQGCLANNLQWWIKAIRQVLRAVRRPASCRNGGAALGFGCRNFKAQLWETKFLPIMINSNINRAKVKKYEMICEQDSDSSKNPKRFSFWIMF